MMERSSGNIYGLNKEALDGKKTYSNLKNSTLFLDTLDKERQASADNPSPFKKIIRRQGK